MNNHVSIDVFYGPIFLPVAALLAAISGFYCLITRRLSFWYVFGLPSKYTKRWAIVWGILQIIAAFFFIVIYFNRKEIYHP